MTVLGLFEINNSLLFGVGVKLKLNLILTNFFTDDGHVCILSDNIGAVCGRRIVLWIVERKLWNVNCGT